MKKIFLTICLLLVGLILACAAQPLEEGIYTDEYYLTIYPHYPPRAGETVTLRLRTFAAAQRVTLYSDRELEIPLTYRQGYWWGKFQMPADYKAGGHFFTVWIRYPLTVSRKPADLFSTWAKFFGLKKNQANSFWSKSVVWYRMVKPVAVESATAEVYQMPTGLTFGAEEEEPLPIVSGEAQTVSVPSLEAFPFIIKGVKTLAFSSKSIEGSKEGFAAGVTREEALRLNISGKSDDAEVDATLISTSTQGTSQVAQREEKISVLVKKASTEAYLGDFTEDSTETEFTRLNRVLSGVRVRGDYERWGFSALYSSPKGGSKYKKQYGDGTQGPFRLDAAPVVINSERVYVDGVPHKRGDDYTVDYQAGTVTFIRRTIDPRSVLEIYYDYRQTVYQHATYGLRGFARPRPGLKIGATYLDDSDSLSGAAEIRSSMSQEAVNPSSHFVTGVDGALVSDILTLKGEAALSSKNFNLLSPGSAEVGKAAKLELTGQFGPFGLSARGKRVGAKFLPIADPNPRQEVTEYGGILSFRPNSLFGAQGSYSQEKYLLAGVVYDNRLRGAKAGLTPERLPSLDYSFSENSESNDPVTGGRIERTKSRNSAESVYRFGFLAASLKGTSERWLVRSPSEEVTNYRRVNFGLAAAGLEKITFSSNVELEDRTEPTGLTPYRRTYNLNFSATPSRVYFFSTSLEYLDDSAQGARNTTDLSYRAEPHELVKTDGKYTVTTLKEDYATRETVSKQAGSFSLDFRPFSSLRLRYLFKPNFTRILSANVIGYSNEQQQAEINLLPLREALLGVLYKQGRAFDVSKQNYALRQNTTDSDSTLYTLKLAPFNIFSTEFNFLLESSRTAALATAEPLSYNPGSSAGKKIDAIVKTSLTEKFSIDSRYTYQRGQQGTGESAANLADSVSHTASLKGIWNPSEAWSFTLSGSYTRATNYLSVAPLSYTVSPGFGLIFRQGELLRLDFNYTYARSYAGSETEKTNYSLRAKYGLSDYVNLNLRLEREISARPDYKLTDITGNIEINL